MTDTHPPDMPPPDVLFRDSVLYQLAVVHSARQSGDLALECSARKRLAELGCRIIYVPADEDRPDAAQGDDR